MPVGLTWKGYISFTTLAIISMLLGGSLVHNIYKPDLVCGMWYVCSLVLFKLTIN